MRLARLCLIFWALYPVWAGAQPVPDAGLTVARVAQSLFPDLPSIRPVPMIAGHCGADGGVNPVAAYCTSENVIFLVEDAVDGPALAHLLAHLYGHAVQVRHGVADVALREIRRRPEEEARLRGWVTQQVECIAGVILDAAGMRLDLRDLYAREPLTHSHWGRDPLRVGPRVSIGLDARAAWFDIGQTEGLTACAPGEFGAGLLLGALQDRPDE